MRGNSSETDLILQEDVTVPIDPISISHTRALPRATVFEEVGGQVPLSTSTLSGYVSSRQSIRQSSAKSLLVRLNGRKP